ncbi:DUF3883 domain-containing protein [Psychrosphaera sp. B3R10]|uniref:sacsin N-terminal ATP-binding-like domain-containing protein n=1 Tax=unclassified Psychrosphaera TaxID=2641570 RepID=UPI001C0904EF|nr:MULTISPECIES: DUF3883 domain-containing protein [unclassified Psychrosphaera]MBU2880794.1 DUF3883 domain-containing protein [Psychrosphaera sp. I2R16]MBU2990987.1 DUF3883 domain-containing protein [Psychrosphaera sp. B3R10]
MNDSKVPETISEWHEWLSEEETKTLESYLAKPANLIKEFRSERATSEDYKGREVLELLQNAADQAKESSVRGRVVIEVMDEGLLVANTGKAFSLGGVHSLQNHHLSPKRRKEKKLIGCKGLGFRSVLNLTKKPLISSGSLNIAYSGAYNKKLLKQICSQSNDVQLLVSKEQEQEKGLVFPILPFPAFGKNYDELTEPTTLKFKERCHFWRSEGYNTVIGIPFEKPEFRYDVEKQICSLSPEVLLFVPYLDEIIFILPNKDVKVWTKEGDESASLVLENDEPIGIWQIFRQSGNVESTYLDNNTDKLLGYELIIAVPDYNDGDNPVTHPLYSYFPTQINLPVPVVCHATFELDQSRNHLKKCKTNEFVFEKLAEFIAEVAELRAKQFPDGINAGYKIVIPLESYSHDFKSVNFEDLLYDSVSNKNIIPTIDGSLLSPKLSKVLNIESTEWLPEESFGDIAKCNKEQSRFFIKLGAEHINNKEIQERFIAHNWQDVDQRVKAITGIIAHNFHSSTHSSSLLLATNQKSLPHAVTVFNSRKGIDLPELPSWQKLWFLDELMQTKLMFLLEAKDVRSLQVKLSDFGLREYSLGSLISRLAANANSKKKVVETPERKIINDELITAIYRIYKAEDLSSVKPAFPPNVTIEIENQSGDLIRTSNLYFGKGYGSDGNITQVLYEDVKDCKLVALPSTFHFTESIENLIEFFIWLGVNKWPRTIIQKRINISADKTYLEHVKDSFDYPVSFGNEYIFKTKESLSSSPLYLTSIANIDGLEQFLIPTKSDAVAAWLSRDERINTLLADTTDNKIAARKGYDRNDRVHQGALPSYIKWKLEYTDWLMDKHQKPIKPKECIVIDKTTDAIFSRPARPKAEVLLSFGVSERNIIDGWRKGGVITNQFELKSSDIYDKLIELPAKDPKGVAAKALYRWFLDIIDAIEVGNESSKLKFLSTGEMWGVCDGKFDYYPITDLRHDDIGSLPSTLTKKLSMAALSHKVGVRKVEKVFGIKSISLSSLKQKPKHYILDIDLDDYFQKAKPYLYAVRAGVAGQQAILQKLKGYSLKVCSELNAEVIYEGDAIEFSLPFWGWLIDEATSTIYVRSNPSLQTNSNSQLLADSVGSALASMFLLTDGGNFSRLFSCGENERRELLKSIRGDDSFIDIDEILLDFDDDFTIDEEEHLYSAFDEIDDPEVVNDKDESSESPGDDEQLRDKRSTHKSEKEASNDDDDDIEVTSKDPQPVKKKKTTNIKVVKRTKSSRNSVSGYKATDGDFAEKKAIEFEEYSNRFPLRVGQIQGKEGFGCDILSFSSQQLRDDFKSNKNRNISSVSRFIEVKGRKNINAEIELRGNEKNCAYKHSEKYYIYRLSKTNDGEYLLGILKNPLSVQEAVEQSIYVHLDMTESTEFLDIRGGIKES